MTIPMAGLARRTADPGQGILAPPDGEPVDDEDAAFTVSLVPRPNTQQSR